MTIDTVSIEKVKKILPSTCFMHLLLP